MFDQEFQLNSQPLRLVPYTLRLSNQAFLLFGTELETPAWVHAEGWPAWQQARRGRCH
jgi:hypothetical protein